MEHGSLIPKEAQEVLVLTIQLKIQDLLVLWPMSITPGAQLSTAAELGLHHLSIMTADGSAPKMLITIPFVTIGIIPIQEEPIPLPVQCLIGIIQTLVAAKDHQVFPHLHVVRLGVEV